MQSLLNFFRPSQQVTVQQSPVDPAPAPAQPAQNKDGGLQNPGAVPNSPLDSFNELLQNTSKDPNKPEPVDPFSQPLFGADPAKLSEAASKANFLQSIPQELLQKAMSGNDPQAFLEVINHVGQQSLALSAQLVNATVEQAGTRLGSRFKEALPGALKDSQLSTMKSQNPILQHPTSEPLLQMLRDRIKRNSPGMSPQEINAKAEEYLLTWAKELTSGVESAPAPSPDSVDWSNWIDKP